MKFNGLALFFAITLTVPAYASDDCQNYFEEFLYKHPSYLLDDAPKALEHCSSGFRIGIPASAGILIPGVCDFDKTIFNGPDFEILDEIPLHKTHYIYCVVRK